MGTLAGLAALSSELNVPDLAEMVWVMPWDTACIPALFVPRRLVGDSAKYVFKEHGLFVNAGDVGHHRGLNLPRFACSHSFLHGPFDLLAVTHRSLIVA